MNSLVDTHCHLYYEPYINDLKKTIDECKNNGIELLLSIGVDYDTSLKNIEISTNYPEIYCTIGLHPCYANVENLKKILSLYEPNSKIIGIGEAGIDFFRTKNNKSDQIKVFKTQIEFCIKHNIPLIIHTRNAETETVNVLKEYKNSNLKFLVHCFSGTKKFAEECLDLNGYIAFGGMLTFNKSDELRHVCKMVPDNKILIETDSPYLSPVPFRGKTNHPKNIKFIAQNIASIKGIEFDRIMKITRKNFKDLFQI